jgi:ribosomal protein L11 methyltransferase
MTSMGQAARQVIRDDEAMRSYPAILIRPSILAPDFSDLVVAALDGAEAIALDEIEGGPVRAFFQTSEARDAGLATLRGAFPDADIEAIDVPDENWAERSQANLRAVRAGDWTVAPPWDIPSDGGQVIVILPSMGFGTGHHSTTRLCLMALQKTSVRGRSVLDVGTGSGVLALAAARMGASRVVGIDNDPDAITNALENRALNGLDVEFRSEGIETTADRQWDLLIANLTGGVLIKYADRLQSLTAAGGRLILSGLREEEEAEVLRAFGTERVARESEEGWVCVVLEREA